jgi:protocatechuate 3,4-dioxygenase beta subunit
MIGVHPDYVDAMESARIDEAFDLVNSGAWMGQDCNAPLSVANCPATGGGMLTAENDPPLPERSVVGEGYVLTGVVRDASTCLPIANARISFWMANAEGVYDGEHEGMLHTNQQGAYRIQSDPPGNYGPSAHVHLNISAPGYQGLETEFMLADGTGEGSDLFEITLTPE